MVATASIGRPRFDGDFRPLEERIRRDAGRTSLAMSVLWIALIAACAYGVGWRLNLSSPKPLPPQKDEPKGPVVPVSNPGKFGIVLDQGESGSESDRVLESALDSATPTLDPLNVIQIAERTDFDAKSSSAKSNLEGGRIGMWIDGIGTDDIGSVRADHWVIEWGNDTEVGYRRKLDHFGISLGAVREGRLVGAFKGFESAAREAVGNPPSLWFVHQDRTRVEVDRKLLSSSGLKVKPTDIVAQFFPRQLQDQLASLEERYSHRNGAEIRRTVFGVRAAGAGYEFYVIEQQLK